MLDYSDDAARANWGGEWRMPTFVEFQELLNNTTKEWTTQNGVKGYKFTSTTNGKSIFLPAAGFRSNSKLYYAGSSGYYWSSSLDEGYPDGAWGLFFGSGSVDAGNYDRINGHSVRPVRQN